MIQGKSSQTAAFVAAWRALGDYLPPEVQLCHDPFGWDFAPPAVARLRHLAERFPSATELTLLASPLRGLLLWMQLRTRAIDDLAAEFVREGGRQILLLGAGFDCRPLRMASQLEGARWFEVDHPATQARKRAILEARGVPANATLMPWDFERDRLDELPARLQEHGLDPARPTLTIWEGVIPYLTEPAIAATLAAVRTYSAPGSRVVLHYIERRLIQRSTVFHLVARWLGEPMRFGWDPADLPGWLGARGFQLRSDRSDEELARELFPERWVQPLRGFKGAGGRIAVAVPA